MEANGWTAELEEDPSSERNS